MGRKNGISSYGTGTTHNPATYIATLGLHRPRGPLNIDVDIFTYIYIEVTSGKRDIKYILSWIKKLPVKLFIQVFLKD